MLPVFVLAFLVVFSCCGGDVTRAETKTAGPPRIEWEVKNRFRLFRSEADFERHVDAMRHVGVLAAGGAWLRKVTAAVGRAISSNGCASIVQAGCLNIVVEPLQMCAPRLSDPDVIIHQYWLGLFLWSAE